MAQLCYITPNLQSLTLSMYGGRKHRLSETTVFSSITSIHLIYDAYARGVFETILQSLPNLVRLKAETLQEDMDGHRWAEMIMCYLPKLKTLQLNMELGLANEEDRRRFFLSFTTPFWREERRWFVQYHTNPDDASKMVWLYTLPYSFKNADIFFPTVIQSTSINDKNTIHSFDHAECLAYQSTPSDATAIFTLRFANHTSLSVWLPIQTHLLLLLERITALRQLEVFQPRNMTNDDAQQRLQSVLDRTPLLDSLKLQSGHHFSPNSSLLFGIALSSQLIRRIDLLDDNHYFNYQECEQLISSRLLSKCEILAIRVTNLSAILLMISSLPRLRSLIFQSEDEPTANLRSEVDMSL